ncbi:endonuclease VII domain-containing protein [Streptomyces sp. ECR3.8]|uniref:endonuclease VII domain-containing protein n=1 Tax=Streptomyces sp. ECR3.8 TaxID=3461009 RepID=UPI004042BE7D
MKRARHLKLRYGITIEQYEQMLASQRGGCAICGSFPGGKRLAVDHCHVTGRVRALLCPQCNRSIGYYEFIRERAESYMRRYGKGNPLLQYDSGAQQ